MEESQGWYVDPHTKSIFASFSSLAICTTRTGCESSRNFKTAHDSPVVAGKTPVRLKPFKANQAKEHRLEAGGLGTLEVDSVKTAARLETPVPRDIVVAGHVPSVAGFLALSTRLPDVFETVVERTAQGTYEDYN
uniref:Putative traf n=1 Tax=Ixodes ricinus TaxID=34613 RepID=A0A0K8R3J8_IXORI